MPQWDHPGGCFAVVFAFVKRNADVPEQFGSSLVRICYVVVDAVHNCVAKLERQF
jgi:hypothetical protein